jgi:hypothetical protein
MEASKKPRFLPMAILIFFLTTARVTEAMGGIKTSRLD